MGNITFKNLAEFETNRLKHSEQYRLFLLYCYLLSKLLGLYF